ncbi:hypothetical protein P22_1666 [Propionispora sp. 2/2-37]|uniref:N-acetylglucosamine-6-phosphate deacetylase n=1 Tax=Propionispora sp. 2/2-37 TaxID=1677858 RepID=UPI0006BB7515|nr:N-acetylglucosamine-6-phosphate deacetylase [Propionispora sp. 2/2-37]CUH95592.1 hypothetical protein P22_1666 [Propionispora sp. 2/2-37]
MKAIVNARVIMENVLLDRYAVLFDDKIINILPERELAFENGVEKIDARGKFLAPGFIDIHIHGCSGIDTMDKDPEGIEKISQNLVKTGVTSFLPTTMTMHFDRIKSALRSIRYFMNNYPRSGAQVLGCHLEGPFINSAYKGAQDATYILNPDFTMLQPFLDVLKIITLAPELGESETFIAKCREHQIVAAIGHSAATYEEANAAIAAGASHIAHICNAMPPLNHRKPGILGAALDNRQITCELIADNLHVHPVIQRILLASKGIHGIILITDAMRASLLGEGDYDLGGQMVTVKNHEARLASGVIAGSTLTLNKAVYNFMTNTGLSLVESIKTATVNPARRIGVDSFKGSIAVGKDADLVMFDEKINVSATIVRGNFVYRG